ncbi:MAG: amino acid ABC transporter permease [Deltaproteobacteria bacterium]|jgi:polar amino acid transport system permease protein|nr:amino acid ABC transporter permease [Deltaproteobacteria bacterium]
MESWEIIRSVPYILGGGLYTILLVVGALALGFAIGLPLAALEAYGPRPLAKLLGVYVWFFRGVPILVLLFLVFFGLYSSIESFILSHFGARVSFSPFSASLLALGLASSAYQSQIFRGAILSLPRGQFKAALALGFSRPGAVLYVVLPQALRLSIPGWTNEFSILLKDSAVAYVLGTMEIMARAKILATFTYRHVAYYALAGVLYFALTFLGVRLLRYISRETRIPGLGQEI